MEVIYIAGTIVVAGCFYRLRCNHRALYGLTEILAALLLIVLAFVPHTHYLTMVSAPLSDAMATYAVNIFAGIYAFVRGCDNVVTGLREA